MKQEWTIVALTSVEVPVIGQTMTLNLEVSSTNNVEWVIQYGCQKSDEGEVWWTPWTKRKSFVGSQAEAMEAGLMFAQSLHKAVQRTVEGRLEFGNFRMEDYLGKTPLEIKGREHYPWETRMQVSVPRGRLDYIGEQQYFYLDLEIEEGVVTGRIVNLPEFL